MCLYAYAGDMGLSKLASELPWTTRLLNIACSKAHPDFRFLLWRLSEKSSCWAQQEQQSRIAFIVGQKRLPRSAMSMRLEIVKAISKHRSLAARKAAAGRIKDEAREKLIEARTDGMLPAIIWHTQLLL